MGKAWVPKLAPWNVLAGSSDNIRSAVAEMRRAIGKGRVLYVIFADGPYALRRAIADVAFFVFYDVCG